MFHSDQQQQQENVFLLKMLVDAYTQNDIIRKTGQSFFYNRNDYFTAR